MVKVIDRNNLMRFLSILMVWILISVGFVGINIVVDEVSANEPREESHSSSTRALANSPWPCFRGNLNHTGRSPYDTTYNAGKLVWKYETESNIHSSPVIDANGTIYIGSEDGYFYALNPNGSLKWKYNVGYGIEGPSPAIDSNGIIYFEADYFYALYPNGTKKWSKDIIVASAPAIGLDGLVYVGSSECVYAIDPDNGGKGWIFNVPGCSIYSSPAVGSDGTIYFVGYDYFYAVYPNGTLRWKYATKDGNSCSSPAIGTDGTIYFGCDNYFFALYPNGSLRWKYEVGYSLNSSPAIGPNGTIYFYPSNLGLIALNPNGTRKWSYATSISQSEPAIGAEGTIYFGTATSKSPYYLKALNPDGTLRWQYETGDYVSSSPAISKNGTIYFGCGDWYVYAIGGNISNYNQPPVANAGPDQNVTVNQTVLFDGSNSYDLTNDALTYKWDFGDGTSTGWQNSSNTSHSYNKSGTYTVTLNVSDGSLTDMDTCLVYVTPSPVNKYLIFHPMPTIILDEDDHPQDDAIDLWNYVEDEKVPKNLLNFTIISNSNPNCDVTLDSNRYIDITLAMNWHGDSFVTIQVSDGHFTAVQNLTIIVIPVNDPPIAVARPDKNVTVNQTVYFDGSGSYDIESEYLTYKWDFGDGYSTEWLNNSDTSHSFTKVGIYTVTLTVREVTHPPQLTDNDTCIIRVLDSDVNHPPIADAGADQYITVSQNVTLDGTGSYDPDGDILTYRWVTSLDVTLGLSKILENVVFNEGIHKIELVVSDGEFISTDQCVIRVFNVSGNLPPMAKINAFVKLKLGDNTRLSGADSYDEDGFITAYHWDFGDDTESDWVNESIIDHKWNLPGIYTITLMVMDNDGAVGSTIHKITIVQSNGNYTGNDTDTDGDRLPNTWEIQYGLNPYDPGDANLDTDGDSLTNLDEYIMGTDPTKFDTDDDGVVDKSDAFPTDPAASIDSDGDNYPDSWNPGMSEKDSTTGLKLDAHPHDPNRYAKEITDNNYLFIIILIICVIIILLILASVKLFVLKSKRQLEDEPSTNGEMLDKVKHKILDGDTLSELEYSHDEISRMLEKKLKTGQMSEHTYGLIKSEILGSESATIDKINNSNLEGKD